MKECCEQAICIANKALKQVCGYNAVLPTGFHYTVTSTTHGLTCPKGVIVRDTNGNEVEVAWNIFIGGVVQIDSNIDLNGYKLTIF